MNLSSLIIRCIQEFNEQLVEDRRDITIVDYIKELNKKYFNMNIEFIDDFIDLVDKAGVDPILRCTISSKLKK